MVFTRLRGLLVLCMAGLLLGGCASQEPADSGPDMEPIEQAPETSAPAEEPMAPAGPVVENGKIIIPMNDSMRSSAPEGSAWIVTSKSREQCFPSRQSSAGTHFLH